VRAVVYSGYEVMPELAQVADPACPPDGDDGDPFFLER
jgi:hypothetical protein